MTVKQVENKLYRGKLSLRTPAAGKGDYPMSKMEELLELEETIAPELLEHMAEADMQKLSVQEQQRVEQMVLQKITALQAEFCCKAEK